MRHIRKISLAEQEDNNITPDNVGRLNMTFLGWDDDAMLVDCALASDCYQVGTLFRHDMVKGGAMQDRFSRLPARLRSTIRRHRFLGE